MAYKLTQKVIDTPGIPVMQKAVLVVMARHCCREDGTNDKPPSVHTVAEKAGMCVRAARVALRSLEADGWIIALGGKAGGRKQTVHYLIVVGKLGETRHDVPPSDEESRHHMPPNGHDTSRETRHDAPSFQAETCETRHEDPLNPALDAAEEVLEEKVSKSLCVELESTRATAPADATHTDTPVSSVSSNIVQFVPPGGRQPLPAHWMPSVDQMAWACRNGLKHPEMTVLRFRDWWRTKGTAKDDAGWHDSWEWWVLKDVERQGGKLSGAGSDLVKAFNGGTIEIGGFS